MVSPLILSSQTNADALSWATGYYSRMVQDIGRRLALLNGVSDQTTPECECLQGVCTQCRRSHRRPKEMPYLQLDVRYRYPISGALLGVSATCSPM
jgi:hypothetical protein